MWDNAGWQPTRQPQHGAIVANKDKGGRNTKSVAATNLKEKRLDKEAKRTADEAKAQSHGLTEPPAIRAFLR